MVDIIVVWTCMGLGVGHPKDQTCGLKGGFPSRSPPCELPLGESIGCPPFGGWWVKPLGT